jgi:hypothetical protein
MRMTRAGEAIRPAPSRGSCAVWTGGASILMKSAGVLQRRPSAKRLAKRARRPDPGAISAKNDGVPSRRSEPIGGVAQPEDAAPQVVDAFKRYGASSARLRL